MPSWVRHKKLVATKNENNLATSEIYTIKKILAIHHLAVQSGVTFVLAINIFLLVLIRMGFTQGWFCLLVFCFQLPGLSFPDHCCHNVFPSKSSSIHSPCCWSMKLKYNCYSIQDSQRSAHVSIFLTLGSI